MNDLRLEVKFKNGALFNKLMEVYGEYLGREWAEKLGVNKNVLYGLLSMKVHPFLSFKTPGVSWYTKTAKKVAAALGVSPEEIFPESLYRLELPGKFVKEFDSVEILSLQDARRQGLLPAPEAEVMEEPRDFSFLYAALEGLDEKESTILKARFGMIGDGEEVPLEQLARVYGCSRERIRQIEKQALRRLRHPSHHLRDLVEEVE